MVRTLHTTKICFRFALCIEVFTYITTVTQATEPTSSDRFIGHTEVSSRLKPTFSVRKVYLQSALLLSC